MAGAYFGPKGISNGADEGNLKGFWERIDVRAARVDELQSELDQMDTRPRTCEYASMRSTAERCQQARSEPLGRARRRRLTPSRILIGVRPSPRFKGENRPAACKVRARWCTESGG
jgi:hypothetical protein